ncbi:MAG: hypothetical protein IJX69_06690 [Oscillospiraceae bacterium]|nr:hypothetical protein [Oscillospiraceae bacterium]
MKTFPNPTKLKILTLAAGALALELQTLLYATGVDEKGLLVPNHPAGIAVWALTILMAVILFCLTRPIQGPRRYLDAFPPSIAGGVGALLAAIGAAISALQDLSAQNLPYAVAGFLCAGALVMLSLCRATGHKAPFLLHIVVSVCFALRLLALYHTWSFNPQLHNYCFKLFACIGLATTGYQLAAFDLGKGSHRTLWLSSLASVFLCFLSLRDGDALFFITGGCFALTATSSLKMPRRK